MNISMPIVVSPAAVPAMASAPQLTRDERQHALLLHQIVRASVGEGGQDKVLLDLGDHKLWVESKVQLRTGAQLTLQVVETHPELKLRVLEENLFGRLGRALHLLEGKSELSGLMQRLIGGQEPGVDNLNGASRQVLAELAQFLRPGEAPPGGAVLAQLNTKLGIFLERQLLLGNGEQAAGTLKAALLDLGRNQDMLRGEAQQRLLPVLETLRLLPPAGRADVLPPGPAGEAGKPLLEAVQALLRASPENLTPAGAERVAAALEAAVRAALGRLAPPAEAPLQQLLGLLPQLGALAQLGGPLPPQPGVGPGGRDLVAVLVRLLRAHPEQMRRSELAHLGERLAGGLEQELLRGFDQARERSQDLLQYLELWQMCRAKLAEDGGQFVPLPFPFLEHGYLVARRQHHEEAEAENKDGPVSLNLFLDLEGLGVLSVAFLYEAKGDERSMYLRFSCRDQEAADYLSSCREELGEQPGGIPLRGAAFVAGATTPARALVKMLMPPDRGIVDARI